jgi:maltose alpha-D-glucosyltransferase/alpha-amylase
MKTKRVVSRGGLAWEPDWYKHGTIYELHVRAFYDSDGNGTGDFKGLITKLDYLRDLGVTALWLLPFYPSPLRDDGYDIADYYSVHPMYGSLADFRLFLREAHKRGLRVITELVMNHTSDQHPWFQRARRSPAGSRYRDYYVWSDTAEKYLGTRIIFKDVETSNWSWDPVAGAYYWHRFFSHQPDLNFENPVVHREMLKVVDFWLDMGVDGLRLDAVPYLYEREGTSCENLPETHAFLKKVRGHVDEKYGDRMLLAEANQWPEEAVPYFGGGAGDECHMAFHFPLMPRLFMAVRMEDRVPIVDILQQTPAIPASAQWAVFLRNHDELTLEMVTDEERDYMYRMYAQSAQARLNLGIRRRLAPLLGNDRKRIELLNALLFSLPGTPVIYYGDELGMGENIYLGDRNGVRTPMQWSADRNAGFSRANPQSLYLPINFDPENHYEAVNVDVQEQNPHSLLWWMRRLIALRRKWSAFGLGTMEWVEPENHRVLAFVRRHEEQCILVVANLSRFVQPVELDLAGYSGMVPVELFGQTEFPVVGDRPYFLTLGPHGFYWLSLTAAAVESAKGEGVGEGDRWPLVEVESGWDELLKPKHRAGLESVLELYLPERRWFGGKGRRLKGVHIEAGVPLSAEAGGAQLVMVRVEYVQSEPDVYLVPLTFIGEEEGQGLAVERPGAIVARVRSRRGAGGWLVDGLQDGGTMSRLLEIFLRKRAVKAGEWHLNVVHTPAMRGVREGLGEDLVPVMGRLEQSNSSVLFGDRLMVKVFRRLEEGVNPDLDIGQYLAERGFEHTPAVVGSMELGRSAGGVAAAALVSVYVPNARDAWEHALDALGRFLDRVMVLPADRTLPELVKRSVVGVACRRVAEDIGGMLGTFLESARLLGDRTAALHEELAMGEGVDFVPEPFTNHYVRGLYQSMRNLTSRTMALLRKRVKALPEDLRGEAEWVLSREQVILERFRAICSGPLTGMRIRHHGDFHLGQVLYTGKDFLLVDFEGEPARSLGERRLKRSPLRDVAGMLRSFSYAAHAAMFRRVDEGGLPTSQVDRVSCWLAVWQQWIGAAYVRSYLERGRSAVFLPRTEEELEMMLDVYLLEKAIYELGYELNNRPLWLRIPLRGIRGLLGEGV